MQKHELDEIHQGIRCQYVLKDMQEMGVDKYVLSDKYYLSYKEAVNDIESIECLFRVWCKFENPEFLTRERRARCVSSIYQRL